MKLISNSILIGSIVFCTSLLLTGSLLIGSPLNAATTTSHGISIFGDLKYPPDFKHFEYASPDAIKGGTVRLSELGSYDSLNPFILKGVAARGLGRLYDTLLAGSSDEVSGNYGLVAESVEVPDDKSWALFNMRQEAQWHDGKPMTADDVVWTLDTIKTKGHPFYQSYYGSVEKAEAVGSHQVKFYFSEKENAELPIVVGGMSILPKHYYQEHDFETSTMEPPLGSSAYKIGKVDAGRSISYERVKNYWGADLAVNVGANNFDTIRHDYYRDLTVALEALKAGDVDFREEYISKNWKTAYDFPALNAGKVIKEDIPDGSIQRTQAFAFNLRLEKYADIRVRQALGLAYDFEWMNKNLFFDAYKRNTSYFQNSEMQATGLPTGAELELLEPYRGKIPDEVFSAEFTMPKTDGRGNPRQNYRKALMLFKEAGWAIKDGKMTNMKSGEKFTVDFITRQPSTEKTALTYKKSLERIGIDMSVRVMDTAQWVELVESFKFDFITRVIIMPLSPGNEQRSYWTSKAADDPGSSNSVGIKDPVVDELVEKIIKSKSREEQVTTARALDRVLLHSHYMVPLYFGDTYRVAYWNKFSRPEIAPKHSLGFVYWWIDPQKEAALSN